MNPTTYSLLVLRRLKPYHRPIAFFFLFLFASLLIDSCSYYYKRTLKDEKITLKELNKNFEKGKTFVLMTPKGPWVISKLEINDDKTLDMSLMRTEYSRVQAELNYLKTTNKKIVKPGHELLQQMVLLHTNYYEDITDAEISLPLSSIQKVEIYDADVGTTIFAVLGITAGILGIIAIIALLTKSSCPFLYVYDGEDFTLAAETFGGAIYPGLERNDFMPLAMARPLNGQYQFKLRNELQEIQYINKVALHEALIPENTRLGIDLGGNIHTLQTLETAISAKNDNYEDVTASLAKYDSMNYNFDNNPEVNNLTLKFKKPAEARSAKLVLRAKGTLWFDYVFGEFLKLFGTQYEAFAEEQKAKTPDQMGWWSKEQHIPLAVSLQQKGEWQVVEEIQPIGPLTQAREIVIPLDLEANDQEQLEIKLSTGFYFWEIDFAAIDYSTDQPVEVRSSTVTTAAFNGQTIDNGALDFSDATYVVQAQIGDVLDFSIMPQFAEDAQTMVFLEVGGYYTHVRDFKNSPELILLNSFKKPGRLSAYSKELYDYNTAPLVASGQDL